MFDRARVADAIAESVRVPAALRRVAGAANYSLYHGPLYLDADGEDCCCFDDGARPFDFPRAVAILSDWADRCVPGDLLYESWSGCVVRESDVEWQGDESEDVPPADPADYRALDRETVLVALFGRELASYL